MLLLLRTNRSTYIASAFSHPASRKFILARPLRLNQGPTVTAVVLGYYSGITTNEDAFDMRKSTLCDKDKQSLYTKDNVINPDQLDYY